MDVIKLAKYAINSCIDYGEPVTNIGLQKVLYAIQKTHLQCSDKPYFKEHIEAWHFGPCIPVAYFHFAGMGCMPITIKFLVKIENKDEKFFIDLAIKDYFIHKPKSYPLCEAVYEKSPRKILTLKEIKEER